MIELDVFFHTDKTASLQELDLDYNVEDCEIRTMCFMEIVAIAPHFVGDKEYTTIHANGSEFICTMDYESLLKELSEIL